jgi:hypothetical protein
MESMEDEEGEIGSASGGTREGQPCRAHALPEQDVLRLAYREAVCGCNYDSLDGAEVGFK